jgi:hypothetical protein
VNQAGHRILSGSPLAHNQHRDIGLGQQRRLGAQLLHHQAGAHEASVLAQLFDILAGNVGAGNVRRRAGGHIYALPDHRLEVGDVKRLVHYIFAVASNRFLDSAGIFRRAKQHRRKIGPEAAQPAQEMHWFTVLQRNVQHQRMNRRARLHPLQGFPTVGRRLQMPGRTGFHGRERAQHGGIAAHHQQAYCFCVFRQGWVQSVQPRRTAIFQQASN